MSLIEFKCPKCAYVFDEVRFSWGPESKEHLCPECGTDSPRYWGGHKVAFNVKQGKAGNYKDGYTGERNKKVGEE